MDFKEIEDLKQEDIMGLYDDIIEFGDDIHLGSGGCCCSNNRRYFGTVERSAFCLNWCRSQGLACFGWDSHGSNSSGFYRCDRSCYLN